MKQDIVQLQQTAVHNHTATMIEIGTNLLSQTAEQTRKLTNVEAQVRLHPYFKHTAGKHGAKVHTHSATKKGKAVKTVHTCFVSAE